MIAPRGAAPADGAMRCAESRHSRWGHVYISMKYYIIVYYIILCYIMCIYIYIYIHTL